MFDGIKRWWASLRRVEGIELPDQGRSSVEPTLAAAIAGRLSVLGTVSPIIDFEMLRCLKMLWIFNPDLSQYVANIVNLGNTGHDLVIKAQGSRRVEAALGRLNDSASRIYRNGCGVDGLLNAYLTQIAWSGALSSEDVVNFEGRRVEQVVIVPVEQIRFQYVDGGYVPLQLPGTLTGLKTQPLGLIRLNPETYKYYALTTVENSPYAKPPASAAVAAITGPQADMLGNITWIAKKLGILGLVSVSVAPPTKRPNETESEYQSRAQRYLANVRNALDQNFNKGLMVTYRDQKVEHANVAADASGAYDVFRINEEQVMSGLAMQPAFFGRTDSTTETYADVVYNLLLAQVGNIQRLVKRRQEATYRLDLLLGGLEVDSISLNFAKPHARDPLKEQFAEEKKVLTVIEKCKAGFISADQGAQELGYDSAFDPELMTGLPDVAAAMHSASYGAERRDPGVTFRFDQASQAYRFVPSTMRLSSSLVEAGNVIRLKKKRVV